MSSAYILYGFAALGTLVILAFYLKPFRVALSGVARALAGLLSLFAINFAGGFFGISLGINIVNGVILGFLGLPGLAALLAVKALFM